LNKIHQILLKFIISIALFAVILYFVGVEHVIDVLLHANPELLAIAVVLYILLTLVMSFRIKLVLGSIGNKLSLFQIFPSNLAGLLASDFTPARIGYFFTAFSLSSKHQIPMERMIVALLGPQLFDFMIKATSAAILTYLVMSHVGLDGWLFNVILLVAVFFAIIFAGLLVFYPPFLDKLSFMSHLPVMSSVFNFLRKMHLHSDKVLKVKFEVIAITFFSWVVKATEWLCLAKAININITGDLISDFFFMMIFQAALTIVQFIPIPTLAGAGASEAGFGTVLLIFGVPLELSVTFALLTRFVMIVVDAFSLPVILSYIQTHKVENVLEKMQKISH